MSELLINIFAIVIHAMLFGMFIKSSIDAFNDKKYFFFGASLGLAISEAINIIIVTICRWFL